MCKEFEISREVELPAPPDDVFQAVATGEGTASWLFPAEIAPAKVVRRRTAARSSRGTRRGSSPCAPRARRLVQPARVP